MVILEFLLASNENKCFGTINLGITDHLPVFVCTNFRGGFLLATFIETFETLGTSDVLGSYTYFSTVALVSCELLS
jgi:hypothetical protein